MNQRVTPIDTLPEPLNGFIFSTARGVVSARLPRELSEKSAKDLEDIGTLLCQLLAMVGTEPVTDIRLNFESLVLTLRQIDEDAYAVITTDPSVGEPEVTAGMNQHLPAFFRNRAAQSGADGAPRPVGPDQIQAQLSTGPVAPQLQALSSRLFQSVGPVAKVIFHDALTQWLGSGAPCAERLEDLATILMEEIRDPEKARAYRSGLPRDLTTWEPK